MFKENSGAWQLANHLEGTQPGTLRKEVQKQRSIEI